MSVGIILTRIVENNTHGDRVDIRAVAEEFGCAFGEPFEDSTLRGLLQPSNNPGVLGVFSFNKKNTEAENNTITALLMAELVLSLDAFSIKKFKCDVFFLSSMRQWRTSAQMLLATRLAIPKHIFEALDNINFRSAEYAFNHHLMPAFVGSAYFITEGMNLFGFLSQDTVRVGNIGRLPSQVLDKYAPQPQAARSA
jgi:hypothetical protein